MKVNIIFFTIIFSLFVSGTANAAGGAAEALGACMSDSLTGKERKQIAQWLFIAMSSHPDIKGFSNVSDKARSDSDEFMGKIVTRLLIENCPEQSKLAVKEGSAALKSAFEVVGKVAMQELMSNKETLTSMGAFEKYMDKEKINTVLSVK
jgi:hypothetical protein